MLLARKETLEYFCETFEESRTGAVAGGGTLSSASWGTFSLSLLREIKFLSVVSIYLDESSGYEGATLLLKAICGSLTLPTLLLLICDTLLSVSELYSTVAVCNFKLSDKVSCSLISIDYFTTLRIVWRVC